MLTTHFDKDNYLSFIEVSKSKFIHLLHFYSVFYDSKFFIIIHK